MSHEHEQPAWEQLRLATASSFISLHSASFIFIAAHFLPIRPQGATTVVNLDLSAAQPAPGGGAAADFTAWPEFHNGVCVCVFGARP
jgi:hypothetical protein